MADPFDIVVVGSGPGGYVAAIKGAQAGKKVALVEKAELGGICLNWGCIPTKALLKSAEVYGYLRHAGEFGLSASGVGMDYAKVIARSREVARQNSQGVQFLMKKNKITVIPGQAAVLASGLLEVKREGKAETVKAGSIILATGASPRSFPQFPIDGENLITYRQALESTVRPEKILIIGAGAIGVEFGYFFNSLGTETHIVEVLPQLLPVEDEEIAKTLLGSFKKQGIHCHLETAVSSIRVEGKGRIKAVLEPKGKDKTELVVDRVLVAVGTAPNTQGLGLEKAGIKLDARGFIAVDEFQRTSVPGIYAIGDVAGRQLLAHKASAEAEVAVAHIVQAAGGAGSPAAKGASGGHGPRGVDYGQIPGCTYCQPQVASVGLTEKALREKKIPYKVGRFPFSASGKARAIGHTEGLVKLLFGEKYGELLGAHIIGSEATEMLAELGLALKLEATWEEIAETVHAHPTLSEAVMEAAWDSQGLSPHQ